MDSSCTAKRRHGDLHAVKRGRLPDKLDRKAVRHVGRHAPRRRRLAQLERHFVGRNAHYSANCRKRAVQRRARVREAEFVGRHQALVGVRLGERQVHALPLRVRRRLPAHGDPRLRLRLFHLPVVVRLQFHQRAKDVLILFFVFIKYIHLYI